MPPPTTDIHDTFVEIKIHTAKCDSCNKHNKNIIFRCLKCGQQCCTPCWQRKGGDDKHVLNGGDRGFAKGTTESTEATPELQAGPSGSSASSGERAGRKRKRLVRGRIPTLEDEAVEDQAEGETGATDDEHKCPPEPQSPRPKRRKFSHRRRADPEPSMPINTPIPANQEPLASIRAAADHLLHAAAPRRIPLPPEPASRRALDHTGLAAILLAAALVEHGAFPPATPPPGPGGEKRGLDVERRARDDEEAWGQDAQARSPLFVPEDPDLCSQGATEPRAKAFVLDAEGEVEPRGDGSGVERMRWCYGMGRRDENGVRGWR